MHSWNSFWWIPESKSQYSKRWGKTVSVGGGLMNKVGDIRVTLGGKVGNLGGTGPVDPTVNLQLTYEIGSER